MIAIQKLNRNKCVRFSEIPQFTFFENNGDLYYKTPTVVEPIPHLNGYKGPSWNAVRVRDGETNFIINNMMVLMVDVTINYKTTNTLST